MSAEEDWIEAVMEDEVFAILLPTGRLWGFRYSHESAAEECAALNDRDGHGHSLRRLVPADEIDTLRAEVEQKTNALRRIHDALTYKSAIGPTGAQEIARDALQKGESDG